MKLSIVTTLYCSENYIVEFYERILIEISKLEGVNSDYELVIVDDGSPDDSLSKAIALIEIDANVKVIELSKNHGHHRAMMIGMEHMVLVRSLIIHMSTMRELIRKTLQRYLYVQKKTTQLEDLHLYIHLRVIQNLLNYSVL